MKNNGREILKLLEEMIKINSVNPVLVKDGNGESEIAQFIGIYLAQMGLVVEYQEVERDRLNVIGVLKGNGDGKNLMLNGHTDTVAIEGMEIEPLLPKHENGKVYGRGSLDMKSGLAAMIGAVKSIIDSGVKLKGDVILAFVADEEYASKGTEVLVEKFSADAAIIFEPTDLEIAIAHKGFAWAKIEIFGKAAHGSMPDKGIDAITKAGKVLIEVENLQKNVLSRKQHQLLGFPSIHASSISGGKELSTYPDYCKIELERRTLPGETREDVMEEIQGIINKIKASDEEFKADFDVFFYRPALEVSKEELIVKSLEKAFTNRLRISPHFIGMSGWMDSAILASVGIPTVIYGPSGDGCHAATEYVEFASVIDTARILTDVIIDFCGISKCNNTG
ncbi:MAG: hypothetical protein APF76_03670 [Desulfitibacter sp. BRH_c19]|nr:MAG: hypothetical protein APF76_03670 [Desulfitibacter sp. BRH_c19]